MNRISGTAIVMLMAMASPAGAQDALRDDTCGRMLKDASDKIASIDDPSLHIMEQTRAPGPFVPGKAPPGQTLSAFYCVRSDIVPASNDYKVVQQGYPFAIYAMVDDEKRVLFLEIQDGRLQVRFSPGKPLPAETRDRLGKFLDTAQPHFYKNAKD